MSKISRFFIPFLMICFVCVTVSQVRAVSPTWDGSIDTSFADGDGTEANPYQISTPAQLSYLAKLTNGTKDYSKDKYFMLKTASSSAMDVLCSVTRPFIILSATAKTAPSFFQLS